MGIVSIPITVNITGISIIKDALIFPIVTPMGRLNGAIDIAIPLTKTKLKRFAPIKFPSESAPLPLTREVIAVTSSGREVPIDIKVSEITVSGTPKALAIICPFSTRRLRQKRLAPRLLIKSRFLLKVKIS